MSEHETPAEKPVMPTADEADAAGEHRVDAPRLVRATFWVWLAAGFIGLLGAVLFMGVRDRLVESTLRSEPKLDRVQVQQAAIGYSWWLLIGSIVFMALFALLAYKARAGARKARTLLVAVGAFAAFFQYGIGRVGLLGLVAALVTVVAIGLMYFPAARRFYAESPR